MVDVLKTLDFLDEICQEAEAAKLEGDMSLLNNIGQHAPVRHYLTNVRLIKSMSREQWARDYNPLLQTVDRLRENYEGDAVQAEKQETRFGALEAKLDKFIGLVTPLLEARQSPAEDEDEPEATPKRKRKAKPAPVTTDEDDAESDESEDEDAESES